MTEDKIDIKSLNFTELLKLLEEMGEKKFRAKQLYEWIHKRLVLSFDEMTNLSKDMRKKLDESCTIEGARIIKKQVSSDGTAKFLMRLSDGNTVESVLMKYKHGMHFNSGRMPYGMQILCIYGGWTYKKP